jgi:hypothetical protein
VYDWIKGCSLVEYCEKEKRMDFDQPSFHMEKVTMDQFPSTMTALAQYFTAGSIWLTDNFSVGIPGHNEEVRRLIMEELASHFVDVKLCITEGEIETIYMQHVRPESKKLFADAKTSVLPVMEDLYRHHEISEWRHEGRKKLLYYTVNISALKPYDAADTQGLKTVLRKAYLDQGKEFVLMPLGWLFDDSLRDSIALRFFAGFVPSLTLVIDSDSNQVITLQMSREEFRHPVMLNTVKSKLPRRNKDCLYLDIGMGLIYVVNLKESTVYRLAEDEEFEGFNHENGEPIPEGVGFFFDQDFIKSMIEVINQNLAAGGIV